MLPVFVRLLTLVHAMLLTDFLNASHEYWKLVREFWYMCPTETHVCAQWSTDPYLFSKIMNFIA